MWCRIYQNNISSNRVMIQTVTLSHKQFNASLGKLAAIQHLSPKPANWTGCDGALKAAKEAVRKPVIPWCVIRENYGQAFHMCKRVSLISIYWLYCKAFQLVSLAVDWRDRSAACSVWLWPQWLLQGSHCQEVRTGQQFLFANLLNVVFFRYHSAKINVSFVKCQVKLVLQEKAFLANAYSMMGQCQGMVGKMKARQPNSSVTR